MAEKKPALEGWQPIQRGYQPTTSKPSSVPGGNKVQGGYQPTTNQAKPVTKPPPKKP